MILTFFWRVVGLTLMAFAVNVSSAYAHSLPGSVLTFSQQGESLNLTVTFPLEDLAIAEEYFHGLEENPAEALLSEQDKAYLFVYFQQHLEVEKNAKTLPYRLTNAELKSAYHHDLGNYVLVVSHLTFSLDSYEKALPLTLDYDAVMHEIRSHRATVYWQPADGERQKLSSFRYKRVEGKLQTYLLHHS
ncbi:MAG: hypothetical protein ABJN96_05340 [Marinomonas sp.]